MKVAVSACLLGESCKYSGGSNRCERLLEALRARPDIEVIPVCPRLREASPRRVRPRRSWTARSSTISVKAWTPAYRAGVAAEMGRLSPVSRVRELAAAVLQSRSPSCGVHEVYDGTFTGTLVSGRGLFAQALAAASVMLVDASEV